MKHYLQQNIAEFLGNVARRKFLLIRWAGWLALAGLGVMLAALGWFLFA